MSNLRGLFPPIEPNYTSTLKVSDIHILYYEESGNPNGKPVIFLHGGPGCGTAPSCRQFFDPKFYRIILVDQRGAGKSTPHAEIKENNTDLLIADLEKLREELKIDKWLVFGGSWGTTLALTYAIKHPDRVVGLILRAIFLGRKTDMDWLFEEGGVSNIYPEYWEKFIEIIPEEKRDNLTKAYYEIFTGDDQGLIKEAAKRWADFESSIITLYPATEMNDDHYNLSVAKFESHYFYHNMFLPENYILDNAYKIKDIPTIIVHGRYDMDCRIIQAYLLNRALDNSDLRIVLDAGHASSEPGIVDQLVKATDEFKKLFK